MLELTTKFFKRTFFPVIVVMTKFWLVSLCPLICLLNLHSVKNSEQHCLHLNSFSRPVLDVFKIKVCVKNLSTLFAVKMSWMQFREVAFQTRSSWKCFLTMSTFKHVILVRNAWVLLQVGCTVGPKITFPTFQKFILQICLLKVNFPQLCFHCS